LEAQTNQGLGGKEPNMLIIGCDYHPGFQQYSESWQPFDCESLEKYLAALG